MTECVCRAAWKMGYLPDHEARARRAGSGGRLVQVEGREEGGIQADDKRADVNKESMNLLPIRTHLRNSVFFTA